MDTISRLTDSVSKNKMQVKKIADINKKLKNYNCELYQQKTELKEINIKIKASV